MFHFYCPNNLSLNGFFGGRLLMFLPADATKKKKFKFVRVFLFFFPSF